MLLENYLGIKFPHVALKFEARDKSNRTLTMLNKGDHEELLEELSSSEILNGYQIIQNFFQTRKIDKNELSKKLENVFLVRVQVPQDIDLNHYFEIMNTRGEQLELHEIAKAKFLEVLDTKHDKKNGSMDLG